jgi:photosystem II stability/assembly factor-like uncharacterized protein
MYRSTDGGSTWEFGGTWPAAILVADPTNPDVLYTISYTASGPSIVKTADGGVSWQPANSGLPGNIANPFALAPSSPSTLYALSGSPPSVYRSDDGAATWSLVGPAPGSGYFLVVDAFDSETLYLANGSTLWVSHDGGVQWNPSGAGLPADSSRYAPDPRTPGTVWAFGGGGGVYKSVDSGATFSPANVGIETQGVLDVAFDGSNALRLYAAGGGSQSPIGPGGLFLSENGGASWAPVDLGISSDTVLSVAVDPSNASRVLAGATQLSRGRLMITETAGASWQRSDHGLSGYYDYVVAPHPSDPETAFGFSSARFFSTGDGGEEWSQVGETQFVVDQIVFDPTDPMVLYGEYTGYSDPSYYGGVYKSVDGGATWNDSSSGLTNGNGRGLAIGASDSNVLLASNTDGIFLSTNGAGSWDPVLTGFGRAVAVDPADAQILYAAVEPDGGAPTLQRSPDGGATWDPPSGAPAAIIPDMALRPDDPSTVYAVAGADVYKSIDRGLTFVPASTGLPPFDSGFFIYRIALDPSAAGTLYVGGIAAPIYRSTDAAGHWQPLPGRLPFSFGFTDLSVAADGRRIYASGDNGVAVFERSFLDVPDGDPFWSAVDAAAMNGITAGCGQDNFCPEAINSRAQVSVFLLRAKNGAAFLPPPATGSVFGDVPASAFAASWIEELAAEGISAGCGGGNFCPNAALSRAEGAVMVLKALHGSDFNPPPATGTVFADVPADAFAASWIEELAAEGISAGCGGGNFCPDASLTRAQAAALLAHAFQLS